MNYINKKCMLCKDDIVVKKGTNSIFWYCEECKKTEEYKKKINSKKKLNCKLCGKKQDVNIFTRVVYCSECKKTKKYKNMKNKQVKKGSLQNAEVQEKRRQTWLKRYGVDHNFKNPEIRDKAIETMRKNGKDHYFRFTKPHLKLKYAIEERILEHNFESEKRLSIGRKLLSLDEIDRKRKIIIFVDGDYWHGNPKFYKKDNIVCKNKVASNVWKYDKWVTKILEDSDYIVLRFWEDEIKNNLDLCIQKIQKVLDDYDKLHNIRYEYDNFNTSNNKHFQEKED